MLKAAGVDLAKRKSQVDPATLAQGCGGNGTGGTGRKAPPANNGNAKPHGGKAHNQAIDTEVKKLQQDPDVTDIRKNQVQVDANGKVVGNNRPDLQYTRTVAATAWNMTRKKPMGSST